MSTLLTSTSTLKIRYTIILLICLSVLVYIPVLSSGFFIFDDFGIVKAIKKIHISEAINYLWTTSGRYWRPVVISSFFVDINWLGANSALMHLHNIVIHATNALLVFWLVRTFTNTTDKNINIPLLTAAFFALHPINTETVAWIAARTDLYATLFSLAGLLLYFRATSTSDKLFAWCAAFSFILGGFSKETGVTLFLAAGIGVLFFQNKRKPSFNTRLKATELFQAILPYLMFGAGYFLLRKSAFQSVDESLEKVVIIPQQAGPSMFDQAVTALTALGFYFKKVFIPTPLNFAIDSVSGFYLWIGILVLLTLFAILIKRKRDSIFLIVGLFSIAPALLNAIFHIAWTPYAERYLYLPTAMMCIFCGIKLIDSRLPTRIVNLSLLTILCIFLVVTLQRNLQWMNYSEILEDAIKKTPDNINLSINYAIVIEEEDPLTARYQLHHALRIDPDKHVINKLLAMIALNTMQEPELARHDLEVFFKNNHLPNIEILELMIATNNARLAKEVNQENTTRAIKTELARSYVQLYELTKNTSQLFKAVQFVQNEDEVSTVQMKLRELVNKNTDQEIIREATRHLSQLSSKDLEKSQP